MLDESAWAMIASDDPRAEEACVAALEAGSIEVQPAPTNPHDVLVELLDEALPLPPLLLWCARRPTEVDLTRLSELHRLGVGVVIVRDHEVARRLRRADRMGVLSRAWRYASVAVVSPRHRDGLLRIARELLRNVELYGPAASWRTSRLCMPAA